MDFDEAISVHSQWKRKLEGYLRQPDQSISPEKVCLDNQCDLGKWIYASKGESFAAAPEFEELRVAHANFHKAAADIVRRADKGENVSADVALGASSDFAKYSSSVVQKIMAIRRKAA